MLMFQPVGGMDRIPYALAEAVRRTGGRIVYDAPVVEVINIGGGVQVAYRDGHAHPRGRRRLRRVHDPAAGAQERHEQPRGADRATRSPTPSPVATGKIGLEYSRRFWEEDEQIFGGITNTNMDLSTIWYPSYGYLGDRGLVVGYYNFGANAVSYGDAARAGAVVARPGPGPQDPRRPVRAELRTSFSVAWQKIRYSEGGWVSWPSRTSGQYAKLLEPDGNVYFAGDHLSYYIAWQSGAIESARKVVMQIHDRVRSA